MLDYHERAAERLTEMDRDLGTGENGPVRTGDERLAGHAMTSEAAEHRALRSLARGDVAPPTRPSSSGSRGGCSPTSATRLGQRGRTARVNRR